MDRLEDRLLAVALSMRLLAPKSTDAHAHSHSRTSDRAHGHAVRRAPPTSLICLLAPARGYAKTKVLPGTELRLLAWSNGAPPP